MARSKPLGRRTAYAFFVREYRRQQKKHCPDKQMSFAQLSKRCGKKWRKMTYNEKKRFHRMSAADKIRCEKEMKKYESTTDKRRYKQMKDPCAPKRPLTAFFWFCKDHRGCVRDEHPEYSVVDIARELGRRWRRTSDSLKCFYQEKAEKDRVRYYREMMAYKRRGKVTLAGLH